MTTHKIKSYHFGIFAEFLAIFLLKIKGYKILARRYKTKLGEIDIIATKKNFLIAAEVKARNKVEIKRIGNKKYLIDEIVGKNQRERIKKTIIIFIKQNPQYQKYNIRFDLIVISLHKIPHHFLGFWQ